MKRKISQSILYVGLGGVIIENIHKLSFYVIFPRFELNSLNLNFLTIILGTLIAVVVVCTKSKFLWQSLLRWLLLIIVCFLVMLFYAYTGFTIYLLSTLESEPGVVMQNVMGLQYFLSYLSIFGKTLIIIFLRHIFLVVYKVIKNKRTEN